MKLFSNRASVYLLFASMLFMWGCGTFSKYGVIEGKISFSENAMTKDEAKEAIKTLRDNSLFPELDLQDVEISDYNFTLKYSPVKYIESESRSRARVVPFFDREMILGRSNSSGTEHEVNKNRTIWFKDVMSIQIGYTQLFSKEKDERSSEIVVSKIRGDYRCLVVLNDWKEWEVFSTSLGAVQRLAVAIKAMTGAPVVGFQGSEKGCKCNIDSKTNDVIGLNAKGDFFKGGIHLFDRIVSIDGDKKDLKKRVETLPVGFHTIIIEKPELFGTIRKEIFIGAKLNDSSVSEPNEENPPALPAY